jgi:hypothetical protein
VDSVIQNQMSHYFEQEKSCQTLQVFMKSKCTWDLILTLCEYTNDASLNMSVAMQE